MLYPHVPEQHRQLLEDWEAILRGEADPYHNCLFCGEGIVRRGSRGPRRLYCSARCRQSAARGRRAEGVSEWVPSAGGGLYAEAEADGVDYIDAFPGDHPPLNYPVVPRENEPNSEFGWAWEIIGSAA